MLNGWILPIGGVASGSIVRFIELHWFEGFRIQGFGPGKDKTKKKSCVLTGA